MTSQCFIAYKAIKDPPTPASTYFGPCQAKINSSDCIFQTFFSFWSGCIFRKPHLGRILDIKLSMSRWRECSRVSSNYTKQRQVAMHFFTEDFIEESYHYI